MVQNYGGANAYVLFEKEASFGTWIESTKDLGRISTITPRGENELIESRTLSSRFLQAIGTGMFRFNVDLESEYQHGRIFELALGSVAHTGAGDPFTHRHNIAATLPSFTMEYGLDSTTDDVERYIGCKVQSLTLALSLGGKLTWRASIVAQTISGGSVSSTAVVSTLPSLGQGQGTFTIGSDTPLQTRAFEVTFENELNPADKLDANITDNLNEGNVSVNGRITLGFTDAKERMRFLSGASTGIESPSGDDFDGFPVSLGVDSPGANRSVTVLLSGVKYKNYSKPASIGGLVLQDVDFTAVSGAIVTEDNIAGGDY